MPFRDFTKERNVGSASLGDALKVIYGEVEKRTRRRRQEELVRSASGRPGTTIETKLDEQGEPVSNVTTKTATIEEERAAQYQDLLKDIFTKQQAAGDADAAYRIVPGEKGYAVERVDPSKSLNALAQQRGLTMTGSLLEGEDQATYQARLESNIAAAKRQLGGLVTEPAPAPANQRGVRSLRDLLGDAATRGGGPLLQLLKSFIEKRGPAKRAAAIEPAPTAAEYDPNTTYAAGDQVLIQGVLHEVTGLDKDGTPLVDPVQ